MSDTPLCDAADITIPAELSPQEQWNRNGEYVPLRFARELERAIRLRDERIEKLAQQVAYADALERALTEKIESIRSAKDERISELERALRTLYEETADYIRIDHLGDVHHNVSMQLARDALSPQRPEPDTLQVQGPPVEPL